MMRRIWTGRRLRFAVAVIATITAGAALASAGLAGLNAVDFGSAAAHQYPGKKVTVCHRTHSKKHPWVKIRVSQHALKAHLRHGDFVVNANHPCPPTAASHKHKHKGKDKNKNNGRAQKHQENGRGGNHGKGQSGKHGHK